MSESVCVCVCACVYLSVRDHIFENARPIVTKIYVLLTHGRGSVLFWWRNDTLCTSGFMDDVTFAHKPIVARRRRPSAEAQCTRSLGLGYKICAVIPVAGQRPHGTSLGRLK